jgi:hypothetical protein
VALYRVELWWYRQKDCLEGLQDLINNQAWVVTGMLKSTLIGPFIKEAALESIKALLDNK